MKPAPFAYHRPQSVAEALGLLAELPDAKPLAGGQSLGPMLNMRLARAENLVDLNDLAELDYVRERDGMIEIGALTRHHRLATAPEVARANPLLAAAAATIGHYAIRTRGTLGGSLAHADPAAQLPLLAVTLDAEIDILSAGGSRTVPAAAFFEGIMTVDLADGEIVGAARFPVLGRAGWGFELFSRRRGDFAIVAVAATIDVAEDATVAAFRLGIAGVDGVPIRLVDIEAGAVGARVDEGWAHSIARAAAHAVDPGEDGRIPAEYRRELVESLTARALASAIGAGETRAAA